MLLTTGWFMIVLNIEIIFVKIFGKTKKIYTFAPSKMTLDSVLWCNGNTSDSGPEIQGSSPCRTTKVALIIQMQPFLFILCFPF